jgi:hypothetical protein
MYAQVRTLWASREGNDLREYEDAFFPQAENQCRRAQSELLRTAVADGASRGALGREWAQLLTTAFGESKVTSLRFLTEVALKQWGDAYEEFHNAKLAASSNEVVKWHTANKLERGAAATFVMFEAWQGDGRNGGRWHVEVLGDCCLFFASECRQDNDGKCMWESFPFTTAAEIDGSPDLLSTQASATNADALAAVQRTNGTWSTDSRFFLATDEMARWVLTSALSGVDPWPTLCGLADVTLDEFRAWASSRRASGEMKNDDLTLQSIILGGAT